MKTCPNCASKIKDHEVICPHCQEILVSPPSNSLGKRDYRSKLQIFGLPLVHIVRGPNPTTGRLRWAKGVIAIGHLAIGGIAVGTIAYGGIAIGALSFGLLALGAVSAGVFAVGGVATGVLFAMGGAAFSIQVAIGGLAQAPHALGGNRFDQEVFTIIERFISWITRNN